MAQQMKELYEFGSFTLDVQEGRLLRNGHAIPLKPKVFETLVVLVENSGRALTKEELMRHLWPDSFVEEANLAVNISQLRKALGENGDIYIETVPKRGYRFNAKVTKILADPVDVIVRERRRARVVVEEVESDESARAAATAAGSRPAIAGAQTKGIGATYKTAAVAVAIVLTAVASFGLYRTLRGSRSARVTIAGMTKIPGNGGTGDIAISRNGEFIARTATEKGQMSLRVIQVSTGSEIRITEPESIHYGSVAFSPSGQNIYYAKPNKDKEWGIYEVPTLGGASKLLIPQASDSFSLSFDGTRIAFLREDQKESALFLTSVEGSGERKLASRPLAQRFLLPGWSPDGNYVAVSANNKDEKGRFVEIIEIAVATAQERRIGSKRWADINGLAWLPDASGILITANEQTSAPGRLWLLSYPQGEATPLTTDLGNYQAVSISSDATKILTRKTQNLSDVWLVSDKGSGNAKQLTSRQGKPFEVSWASDNRLVYSCVKKQISEIWTMNADGSEQKQVVVDEGYDDAPAVTGDGRYVLFASRRGGSTNIWRMDIDGANLKQLTQGSNHRHPLSSRDGKWVIYESRDAGSPTLWKVSIEGGAPVQLVENTSYCGDISPDGTQVGFIYEETRNNPKLALVSSTGKGPIKILGDARKVTDVHWSPDGHALTYSQAAENNVSNIWWDPLESTCRHASLSIL